MPGQENIFLKMSGNLFAIQNNLSLQFKTPEYELEKGNYKVAVKIVDIFGNDTMKICEVKV